MLKRIKANEAIIDFLKQNYLLNQNIIGVINNAPKAEIYVDNEINPKGVFVRNDYWNYLYSDNDEFIDEASKTLFKKGYYGFGAVERSIGEKIQKKFKIHWNNPCGLYYLPKRNIDTSLIKNKTSSIDIKDAEIIDKYYEYRHPGTIEVIREDIINRPSSAIYKNGELVSWVLVHIDNSMGIMYTKEEHRRNGYAVDVTIDLASKILKEGNVPFVHIVKGNNKSEYLAKRTGFERYGDVIWFGIEVPE